METFQNVEDLKDTLLKEGYLKFKIKVSAGAKTNSIEFIDEFIKIRIMAQAIEGKANKAIIEFLAKTLKHPKSKISILNGEKSSIKTIEIKG